MTKGNYKNWEVLVFIFFSGVILFLMGFFTGKVEVSGEKENVQIGSQIPDAHVDAMGNCFVNYDYQATYGGQAFFECPCDRWDMVAGKCEIKK